MRSVRLPPRYEYLADWAAVPWELLVDLWRHTDGPAQELVRRSLDFVAALAVEQRLVYPLRESQFDRKLCVYAETIEAGVYFDSEVYEAARACVEVEDGAPPSASRVIGRSLELFLASFDESALARAERSRQGPRPPYHDPWTPPAAAADAVPRDELRRLFQTLAAG